MSADVITSNGTSREDSLAAPDEGTFSNNFGLPTDVISTSLLDRIYYQKGRPDLDLSLCALQRVPLDAINSHYGEVYSLDLSYNNIRWLPPKLALTMTAITKLDLSRNELKKLPDNFGLMEQLVYLDVHKNQLETLPLSMGKMRRLKYLDVSDNIFRAPLCNILHIDHLRTPNHRESNGVETAQLVVKFLAKLSHETFAFAVDGGRLARRASYEGGNEEDLEEEEEVQGNEDLASNQITARVRRHRRGTRYDEEVRRREITEMDEDKEWSSFQMKCMGIALVLMLLATFPLIMALFYGTSYLEHKADNHPSWKVIWNVYKPYHEMAEVLLNLLRICERPLHFGEIPLPPPPPEEPGNIFKVAYRKVVGFFGG